MTTTRFILIRHGETNSSRERRFAGATDVPLSEHGLEMAKALGARMNGVGVDAIYVSPLGRCRQTAAPIAEVTGLSPVVTDEIRECNFGDWEDLTINEVLERWPQELTTWAGDDTVPPPNGECWSDLGDRMVAWYETAALNHAGQTVVVVTHGGPIMALLRRLMGLPRESMDAFLVETGSVSMLVLSDGRKRVRLWNDITHLHDPLHESEPLPGYGPTRPPPPA